MRLTVHFVERSTPYLPVWVIRYARARHTCGVRDFPSAHVVRNVHGDERDSKSAGICPQCRSVIRANAPIQRPLTQYYYRPPRFTHHVYYSQFPLVRMDHGVCAGQSQ